MDRVTAQAEPYSEGSNYEKSKHIQSYQPDYSKTRDGLDIKKLKCDNVNLNINDASVNNNVYRPPVGDFTSSLDTSSSSETGNEQEGITTANNFADTERFNNNNNNGFLKDKDGFVYVCVNNNNNEQAEETTTLPPPSPPIPTTASLTVIKEVYGCANIEPIPEPPAIPIEIRMDCRLLQNNDDGWILCDDDDIPTNGRNICNALPENFFDIQVMDNQNNLIREFQGSTGETIENLEPGTYTVKEIKHLTPENELGENSGSATICIRYAGFTDGGQINIRNEEEQITYPVLCFEYEDEQDTDCSTITLAAGESRKYTVKNYIRSGADRNP